LNEAFLQLGFKQLYPDQCVYIRHTNQDLVIMAVHIDNMVIFSSDDTAMAKIKKELVGYFTITDLGELKQIVGMEVEQDWECGTLKLSVSIHQEDIGQIWNGRFTPCQNATQSECSTHKNARRNTAP
jgi:hypothetical protein